MSVNLIFIKKNTVMSIGFLLLVILAIWIVPKLVRGYMLVSKMRRTMRDMQDQMYGNAAPHEGPRKRKGGWTDPINRRSKKIDASVGEYVKFEEVKEETTERESRQSSGGGYYVTEQQISEAEWEDL